MVTFTLQFDFSPRFPYIPFHSVRRSYDLAPLYAMKHCVSGFKAANIRQRVSFPGVIFVWAV